jgi:hypothetical protein
MSDTRILNYVDARTGKDCQINVPKDAAWLMVQTLHIAGVEAYIEFTEDDLVTVK